SNPEPQLGWSHPQLRSLFSLHGFGGNSEEPRRGSVVRDVHDVILKQLNKSDHHRGAVEEASKHRFAFTDRFFGLSPFRDVAQEDTKKTRLAATGRRNGHLRGKECSVRAACAKF